MEATSALLQQWQPEMAPGNVEEVDFGNPLFQAMAALKRQGHSRQLQGKKEDEHLQARQKPVLMSPLFGGLSHHSSTFILDGQSIYGSTIPTKQHSILLYDSHQGKRCLRARFY